jgi:Undecaprenyl-phosphate galactose phosphotransferase WbaP
MDESITLENPGFVSTDIEYTSVNTSDHSGTTMIMPARNESKNLLLVLPHIPMVWVDEVVQLDSRATAITRSDDVELKSSMTRFMDILLITLAAPFVLVVFLVLGALIALESSGGIFYGQTRIGKDGRRFKAYKFRTMVKDADKLLQKYLDESPELKAEWAATHKLKNDPRVTRIGAVLRKYSLDELPQLWNIVIGDMSLIGPRPIVDDEVEKYDKSFELYKKVRPGLTGLWQVSGRSDTSYEHRVELDKYYLLNWSLKLDIQILFRTVLVVVTKKGAY